MRWKLLEKISAGVLSVISGLAALGAILAALHVIPADTTSWLTAKIFASDAGRWTAAGLGLLVLRSGLPDLRGGVYAVQLGTKGSTLIRL